MLRYRVAYAHNSIVLNEHLSTLGVLDKTKLKDTIVLDERPMMDPAFRDLRDPLHLAQGGVLGRVHKGMLTVALRGRILVPDATQQAKLGDRERAIRAAFDPYLCYRDSPLTDGAYAFDFSDVTTDTATYGTTGPGGMGIIPLRYYLRPLAMPRVGETLRDGASRPFSLALVAADPRMYEQSQPSYDLNPLGVYTPQTIPNGGTAPAPVVVDIHMSGAGASNFTITRGGVSFVLDLTGLSNGQIVRVVMETSGPFGIGKTVKVGTVDAFSRKTSAANTWLDLPAGGAAWTLANRTNVNHAFVTTCIARA